MSKRTNHRFRRQSGSAPDCDRDNGLSGAFFGSICNVVKHDPATHGLKRCNTAAAKETFLLADDRHYEMLLASLLH